MTYTVGHHVDLEYLNEREQKKITQADSGWTRGLLAPGTHYDFTQDLKAIVHIPVAFAA